MAAVAIVVPAYNAERYLRQTLQSVLDSDFTDFELIVIDDGSRDTTAAVAESLGDPRIRVIRQANAGMSASRNRGIAQSESEFIALLDADDVWHPAKLRLQVETLRGRPECDLSFTEFEFWHGEDRGDFLGRTVSAALEARLTGWLYPKMVMTNFILPSSALFRRSLWDRLGPFLCDDHQTDDWEYFVRASREAQFAKLAAPLVLYRQHPASLSKKLPRENKTELMRETLLARYGMACPHGGPIDRAELRRRRYLGWRHFADGHVAGGQLGLGLRAFSRLLAGGPQRITTLATLLKSARRRVISRTRGKPRPTA
ncbi:glycosyltransferase family 2 protein [Niveibacterium sp. SC-1]|uniref:glycosyltransferase family 2 protein n=1 Tax=Niveibacterium sp. SC-1 TaxID=3135646 RepID=UPI00311DD7DA